MTNRKSKKAKKSASPVDAGNLHICVILDESGSMASVWDATISGFNEFLKDQQKTGNGNLLTLTKFNTQFNRVLTSEKIEGVKALDRASYVPGGMTALHDAVAHTIKAVEKEVAADARVLCCILTDGEENSSREHSLTEVKDLIEAKQKTGFWTFTYLGANQDAWVVGNKMGIPTGNAMSYAATSHGTQTAFAAMSRGTEAVRMSGLAATSNFYGGNRHADDWSGMVPPTTAVTPGPTVVTTNKPVAKKTDKATWGKRK